MGVADTLLEAVATWARGEAGARRLRIWVVERNAHARLYYEGQGFRSTGTEIRTSPSPASDSSRWSATSEPSAHGRRHWPWPPLAGRQAGTTVGAHGFHAVR